MAFALASAALRVTRLNSSRDCMTPRIPAPLPLSLARQPSCHTTPGVSFRKLSHRVVCSQDVFLDASPG
ncbi:hypothetical protein G6O67_003720 [Ophiocordyceps sinensis]|uniref:Uncharacterized protein n=1 Tax=Ophiocordyceps sinensis TaxID=72228 RepID=A0A8H4V6J6_9HYPO|nr:hypothetical protein G6O67_003720 [Ophiocordyceps sinensis]